MSYFNKFKNHKYKNKTERNKLLKLIIDDCNSYNEIKIDLINIEKEIAVFCTETVVNAFQNQLNEMIEFFCDKLNLNVQKNVN